MQVHVHADARGAIAREAQHLPLRRRVVGIEALPREHLLAVQRPAFDENAVAVLPSDLVREVICNGDLEEVTRNPLVPEDGPRILDGGADVEVPALRIVGGDEVEALRVLVVEPGRIHEAARRGRLERLGQLTDRERAQPRRQRDQPVVLQELDHLLLAGLIRGQEGLLIGRNALRPRRIRRRERRILE